MNTAQGKSWKMEILTIKVTTDGYITTSNKQELHKMAKQFIYIVNIFYILIV